MGNSNSTRWNEHSKKRTVEQSLDLRIKTIYSNLVPGTRGVLSWKIKGQVVARAGFLVEGKEMIPKHIRLVYRFREQSMSQEIELATTPLPWGGVRYWFRCPNDGCGKRASTLFSPLGGNGHFYCRQCHNLTYTSSQQSGRFESVFGGLASRMQDIHPGITAKEAHALVKSDFARRKKLMKSKKYARLLQKLKSSNKDG